MATGRNRPRKDEPGAAHEEKDLWSKICSDLKDLHKQSRHTAELAEQITRLEESFVDTEPTLKELVHLEKLYLDQKRKAEDEQAALAKVLERNELLMALRTATEAGDRGAGTTIRSRPGPSREHVQRGNIKRPRDDSPSNRTQKIQRSNSSAPSGRDKDKEALLQVDSDVAYRLKQKGVEGEWIQCTITSIIGDGPKRRYEVQDPEPDEAGGHGKYKAHAKELIPIPKDSAGLPPYPPGRQVLARYPETTTFYQAEVINTKRDGTCRLRFEGEEEVGKETEVERRLVLDVSDIRR